MIVYEWWPRTALIILIGALLGALYPGLSAARKDPIEALSAYRDALNFLCDYVRSQGYSLKLALEVQQLLVAELQHGVRNTLAVIRSIVRRTAENSETVEDFAAHLDGRIGAYSRVQMAVTRDPLAGFDLAELISEELRACAAREGEQFSLRGPSVRLKPKAVERIGLAMHELATNALKHGALTSERGHIDVRWLEEQRDGKVWLSLEWKESGMMGRRVEQRREGFGTILLRHTLRYDLGAEVTPVYEPSGFRCEIAFPLERYTS